MKKLFAVLLASLLVLSLTACEKAMTLPVPTARLRI